MNDRRVSFGFTLLALAALAVLLVPGAARAEVSVTLAAAGGPVKSVEVMGIIIDDPGPLGNIWLEFQPETSTRRILNPAGANNEDGPPSVVILPSTIPLAAWARSSPSGYDIVFSKVVAGDWTAPQVLVSSPDDELDPVLFRDESDGSIHLVYWVDDGSPTVMRITAPADLSSWSPAVQISLPGEIAVRPHGVHHEGTNHVAYEVHDLGLGSTPRQIVLASHDGSGWSYQLLGMTLYGGENWPQVHSGTARLWVEWLEADDEMCWRRALQPGSWDPAEYEPYQEVEDRDYHARRRIRLQSVE